MGQLIEESTTDAIKDLISNNKIDIFELAAKEFLSKVPCYYDKSKNIYLYSKADKKWARADQIGIINIAKNIFKQEGLNENKVRSQFLNAILDKARWDKPKDIPVSWIQFSDCFYDFKNKERIPLDKKYFSQIKIPYNLGTSTETPIIDKHILSWVGKEQYKIFLQTCAYCMYRDYPFARFFIFYGTGSDGKSTAGSFISEIVGTENSCNIDLDLLNNNRFESQKMFQKTLASCGEVDYKLLRNTRKLKGVTGGKGDPITIEFKNKDPFSYVNFAKILWYANGLPPTYDKTQGFFRRTTIIKFKNKFKELVEPLGDIPDYEYENFCLKCMETLKDLLENGFDEKTLEQKEREYEELSNPILKFVNEEIEDGTEDDFIPLGDLFEEYSSFAKKKAYRLFSYNDFSAGIKAEDFELKKQRLYEKISGGYDYFKHPDIEYVEKDIRKKVIRGFRFKKDSLNLNDGKLHFETTVSNIETQATIN